MYETVICDQASIQMRLNQFASKGYRLHSIVFVEPNHEYVLVLEKQATNAHRT